MADVDDKNLGPFDPVIVDGERCTVEYGVRTDGSSPAYEYFHSLALQDQATLKAYFQHLADNGSIECKPTKFKREKKPFYAFKKKGLNGRLIRIVCYRIGLDRWILTHGFDKPAQSKWDEREFTLATEIRNEQLIRERKLSKKETKQ